MFSTMWCSTMLFNASFQYAFIADLMTVSHFGQVVYIWHSVNVFQCKVNAVIIFNPRFCNGTLRVVSITEHDSVCRAGLLAGCLEISILQRTVFLFSFQFTSLCSLYAERTFFH